MTCQKSTLCDRLRANRPSFFMIGNLEPEENVMDELKAKRKALAVCNQGAVENFLK